jgi:hypothetical protein
LGKLFVVYLDRRTCCSARSEGDMSRFSAVGL